MGIEQQLHFESRVIRLDDGSLFSPLKEASDRWLVIEPASYLALGETAHVLYQVPQRGFILVEYIDCREVHGPNGIIFVSDHAPRGRLINNQTAANFILHFQLELPKELHEIATQPPERPVPRLLETWAGEDLIVVHSLKYSHEVDPIAEAEEIRNMAVHFLQSHQDPQNFHARDSERSRRFLGGTLFRSHKVDPTRWIEQKKSLPPKSIDLLELDWPEHSEPIRDALKHLQSLLRIPFTVFAAGRLSFNDPLYPSMEERELAIEQLRSALPEVETTTEALIRLLADYELVSSETHPTEADIYEDEAENVFQIVGKKWNIRFCGQSAEVNDLIGLHYIRRLLDRPHAEFDILDLDAVVKSSRIVEQGSAGENLDRTGQENLRKHLQSLNEDLDIAKETGNIEAEDRVLEEVHEITNRLSQATGLGGRPRMDGDIRESARKRISNAIERALQEIETRHTELANHLTKFLFRGKTLRYAPDPPVSWTI